MNDNTHNGEIVITQPLLSVIEILYGSLIIPSLLKSQSKFSKIKGSPSSILYVSQASTTSDEPSFPQIQ